MNKKYQGLNLRSSGLITILILIVILSSFMLFGAFNVIRNNGSNSLLFTMCFLGLIGPVAFYLKYKSTIKLSGDFIIIKSIIGTKRIHLKSIKTVLITDTVTGKYPIVSVLNPNEAIHEKSLNLFTARQIILSTKENFDPEKIFKIKWKGTHTLPYYPGLYTEIIKRKASIQ
jgi:hypothetical protein